MVSITVMKLYKGPDPTVWIGEDAGGGLVMWPREAGGWAKRLAYSGQRRQLEEVEPALARGTGWPGGGRAPKPRDAGGSTSDRRLSVRATDAEVGAWERRADDEKKRLSDWARDTLNAEVAKPRKVRP